MQCEKERIIQVSLTKITDSRRRRGGPTLRRNLLVSHVLNNVLTKADTAYQEYRTTVEIDMEVETWDQDEQKPKVLRENESTGGSIATPTGNRTESPHSLCSVGNSTELSRVCFVENGPVSEDKAVKDICSDSRVKESDCSKNERTPQIHETPVTSNKRPRYANEPCDYHVVCSKRFRFESSTESGTPAVTFMNLWTFLAL